MQDDHGTLLEREIGQRGHDPVAFGQGPREIRRRRRAVEANVQLADLPGAARSRKSIADADRQPVHPDVPGVRVADRRNVPPGEEQRLLDGVFGSVLVSKDELGCAVHPAEPGSREDREGGVVAGPRALHQVRLR